MNDTAFLRPIQAPVSLATHSAGHSNALVENPFDDGATEVVVED